METDTITKCWACGRPARCEGHHVIPKCTGETQSPIVPLCATCHDWVDRLRFTAGIQAEWLWGQCNTVDAPEWARLLLLWVASRGSREVTTLQEAVCAGATAIEHKTASSSVRRGLDAMRERGEYLGAAPLGFEAVETPEGRKLAEVEAEQGAVSRARELRAQGFTLRQVADVLTREGFQTKRGGQWYACTVQKVIGRMI